jgi:hypothetical protein
LKVATIGKVTGWQVTGWQVTGVIATELPANIVVVDDLTGGTPTSRCHGYSATTPWRMGHYPSKINFHQLDSGCDAHLWFAQTTSASHSDWDAVAIIPAGRPLA